MRVADVLAKVKKIKPNQYDDDILLGWLNEAEATVETEVEGKDPQGIDHYELPEDLERELHLPIPHDAYYALYIQAQIDFANQEIEMYNNEVTMLSSVLHEYKKYYVRNKQEREPLPLKIIL